MRSKEYQSLAHSFASYGGNSQYAYCGLAEECGELNGVVAKFIRKHLGRSHHELEFVPECKEEVEACKKRIAGELGDVLWFVSEIATLNGLRITEIMEANIKKLTNRKNAGVIASSGETIEERMANKDAL